MRPKLSPLSSPSASKCKNIPCPTFADIASAIRALVKFDISKNRLRAEGTKAVAKALKGNKSMTELNISSNDMSCDSKGYIGKDMSGVMDIANAIPTMGALAKFTISGDQYHSKPVTIETTMTEANFSGKVLQASGAIILAAFLPKCQ